MTEAIKLPPSNIPGTEGKLKVSNKWAKLINARPGTEINPTKFAYVLANGGLGDFICYLRAMQYIAENWHHIHGTVVGPNFMFDLIKHLFSKYKNWKTELVEPHIANRFHSLGMPFIAPLNAPQPQFYTAQCDHPLHIGFAWYANMGVLDIPQEYNNYPSLEFSTEGLPKGLTPKRYAVFTPGGTAEARTVPGHYWNPIIDHVKRQGLLPVLIGKAEIMNGHNAKFSSGINMGGVMDLREQTTILQAAQIMQYSAVTLGLDNGLLHLAGCTTSPIVFGYNITSVAHRRPRRLIGQTVDVFLTENELACTACQSRVKGLYAYDFRWCAYKHVDKSEHPVCIDMLFENGGKRWIDAIDRAIK